MAKVKEEKRKIEGLLGRFFFRAIQITLSFPAASRIKTLQPIFFMELMEMVKQLFKKVNNLHIVKLCYLELGGTV